MSSDVQRSLRAALPRKKRMRCKLGRHRWYYAGSGVFKCGWCGERRV